MAFFAKKENTVDFGATLREWPKKIWCREEIPEYFLPYLAPWLDDGMSLDALVWVPGKAYIQNSFEYMAAHFRGELLALFVLPDGQILKTQLFFSQIISIRNLEHMLTCQLEIFYWKESKIEQVILPYNKAAQYLFLPFLNNCLGLSENFSFEDRILSHPRPEAVLQKSIALYNYSEDAFRLGEKILSYEIGSSYLITHSFLFRTKKQFSWILCHMEHGSCLVEYGQDYHEISYLLSGTSRITWLDNRTRLRLEIVCEGCARLIKELPVLPFSG